MKYKPFITYYSKHKIIPVVDLNKRILKQRECLYNLLRLDVNLFKNFKVLEIGPGVGVNAFFLLKNKIKKIDLVDANSESLKKTKKNLCSFNSKFYKIYNKDFHEFSKKQKYDLVVCENLLQGLNNPLKSLKYISTFVNPGGYLFISCGDEISILSEKFRGVLSSLILESNQEILNTFDLKTKFLSKIFKSHLKTLNTFVRNVENWVQDNLLYEYWWKKKNYLSIFDAISSLSKDFQYYSSSPYYFKDFSWYKSINRNHLTKYSLTEFKKNQHNFIDRNIKKFEISVSENNVLKKIVAEINIIIAKKLNDKNLSILVTKTQYLINFFKKFNNKFNKTIFYLESVNITINNFVKTKKIDFARINLIKDWWGNGTQQLVLRKSKV
jgi:SAM-dependent methyltransferase